MPSQTGFEGNQLSEETLKLMLKKGVPPQLANMKVNSTSFMASVELFSDSAVQSSTTSPWNTSGRGGGVFSRGGSSIMSHCETMQPAFSADTVCA